jgi:hypothetical protein
MLWRYLPVESWKPFWRISLDFLRKSSSALVQNSRPFTVLQFALCQIAIAKTTKRKRKPKWPWPELPYLFGHAPVCEARGKVEVVPFTSMLHVPVLKVG